MQKNMYSLMLMDDVVREIDLLAAAKNTNRSNLVNQILAEYVSMITPEKRIQNIFESINQLLCGGTFSLSAEPSERVISVKSALDYKFRPTIRYAVELYRTPERAIGELKIIFRTQSVDLIQKLNDFFGLWIQMERIYLKDYYKDSPPSYYYENGKLIRGFSIPKGRNYGAEELSRAISDYIKMFDDIIKDFLSGGFRTVSEIENKYLSYLNSGMLIL